MRRLLSNRAVAFFMLALVLAVTAFSLRSTQMFVEAFERQRASQAAMTEMDRVLSLAVEIESSAREYVAAGNEALLEPYHSGVKEIGVSLSSLRSLAKDNPDRLKEIGGLESLINRNIERSLRHIALVREGRAGEARAEISSLRGKMIMDDIRRLLSGMEASERVILERHYLMALKWSKRLTYLIVFAGSAGILFTAVAMYVLRRDLLSRMEAEKKAIEKEAQLRTVLDNAVDGIITINDKTIVESFNRAAERIFGYRADEVIGRNVNMLMPEPYKSAHDGYVRSYIETGRKKIIGIGREVAGVTKDGRTFPLELSVSEAVINGQRKFSGIIRDITEKKAVENKLHDTIAVQRAILDSTRYAIISGTVDGVIKTFNRCAEEMLGYRAEELVDKATPAVFHDRNEVVMRAAELAGELGEHIEPGFESFVAKARRGLPDEHEWTYVRKDGSRFPVLLSITAIRDDNGGLEGFLGVASDITEKKAAGKRLSDAIIEAEAANRAKSEFLANMSHEIRTPMNAIIGMADLLSETGLTDEQREYVAIFQRAGENLLRLINDILDLSKVEAGRLALEETEFDLVELVERSFELLSMTAHEKGLETMHYIAPDVPVFLRGDPERLRQVIFNLVGNAIKFTEKGEVAMNVALKSLDEPGRTCTIEFSVRDTGIGIPPDKLDTVFESFTQMDPSITRKYGGTGLGLTISKRLVELMGGGISVESRAGQGSIFTFTAVLGVAQKAAVERPPEKILNGLKVFIIDDNPTNRLILKEMLERRGASVGMAPGGSDGIEALKLAAGAGVPFKVLFLDRRMPDMDGFETAKAIRKDPMIAGIKIILITSDARREDLARIRETGIMDYYIVKPVKRDDIGRAVNHVLGAPEKAGAVTAEETAEGGQALRILVAEDAEDNRLLIKSYLKRTPHAVAFAENGAEAVEMFKGGGYDIVFMDMQMPVMDGYDATRKIREWEAGTGAAPAPIIALTAYALAGDEQRSRDAGCTAYLSKPVKKTVFMEALSRYGKRKNAG